MECDSTMECDYLVIGAGPRCMAFTDMLLDQGGQGGCLGSKKPPRIIIVDDKDQPGGHWNNVPRFCRLLEDSRHFGVVSCRLEGRGAQGTAPERPTVTDVLAYYHTVMQRFIAKGVKYFPMSHVTGNLVRSKLNFDQVFEVSVKKKVVHSTHLHPWGPASQELPFAVEGGAHVAPPGHLSGPLTPSQRLVVIGSGRMGISVVLWLLSLGTSPSNIHWVMPREALLQRSDEADGQLFSIECMQCVSYCMKSMSLQEIIRCGSKAGHYCRIDERRPPESFHLTSITDSELLQLRKTRLIRLGRVVRIHPDHMILEQGQYYTGKGTLYINCTSSWIQDQPAPEAIFQPRRIILQPVAEVAIGPGSLGTCLSAALTGLIEHTGKDDDVASDLITGACMPDTYADWLYIAGFAKLNVRMWFDSGIKNWLFTNRLSLFCGNSLEPLRQFDLPMTHVFHQKLELILARYYQEKAEGRKDQRLSEKMLPIGKASLTMDLDNESEDTSRSTSVSSPQEAKYIIHVDLFAPGSQVHQQLRRSTPVRS